MSDFIFKSHEEIEEEMLTDFSNELGVDSISSASDIAIKAKVYAAQIEGIYYNQQYVLRQAFVQTAIGEGLEDHGYVHDVKRKPARKANGKVVMGRKTAATEDIPIPRGTMYSTNPDVYGKLVTGITTEDAVLKAGELEVAIFGEVIEPGKDGNVSSRAFTVLNNPPIGIEYVRNDEEFKNGTDEEDDESYRERILYKTRRPGTSGNPSHYEQWALEVPGVGSAKAFRTWNGKNTVKVVICDSNMRAASQELVKETFDYIETQRPVGAIPTIVSAQEKLINIAAKVTLANGYTIQEISSRFKEKIIEYFKSIAFKDSYASYAKVGSMLLDTEGVGDYTELKLNGEVSNILLGDEEIPVLGELMLEVI